MPSRLLVSISSVFADTRAPVDRLLRALDKEDVPVTLLVAPHIGSWHLSKDQATREFIEKRCEAGTALVINGFDQAVQGRRAEFATLGAHEARLRLKGATRQMNKLGFNSPVFAPPRWRLSTGTLEVLPEFGFTVACSSKGLHGLGESTAFLAGRNLSIGEGFGAPKWWRRSIIGAARRAAESDSDKLIRLSISGRNVDDKKTARDFLAAVEAARAGALATDYVQVAKEL